MRKKLFVVAGVVVIAVVMFFVVLQNKSKAVETIGYEVKSSNYEEIISSIGTVEYGSQVEIKAEVSGTLLEVNTEVGENLNIGDLIAKVDDSQALYDYNDTVNKSLIAKARYNDYMSTYNQNSESIKDQRLLQEKEIASLELEKKQLNSKILTTKELLSQGAIPANDLVVLSEQMDSIDLKLETANAKLKTLRLPTLVIEEIQASIDSANESINKQEIELAKYSIKSPINGIVIEKKVEPGTFIQAGDIILQVASDEEKYAVIEIDEKYIGKASIGKKVQIYMESYPDEVVKGTIAKINPEVNKETGTISIKAKILEKPELFLQNMTVNVNFVGGSFDDTIVIPGEYLINGEDSAVYIKDKNGIAVKKEIVVYNKNVKMVRVLDGLNVDDVVLNPKNLEEGLKVNVNLSQGSESQL